MLRPLTAALSIGQGSPLGAVITRLVKRVKLVCVSGGHSWLYLHVDGTLYYYVALPAMCVWGGQALRKTKG